VCVKSVDDDCSLAWPKNAVQEFQQCTLPGAVSSHNENAAPRFNPNPETLENVDPGIVPKAYVVKMYHHVKTLVIRESTVIRRDCERTSSHKEMGRRCEND